MIIASISLSEMFALSYINCKLGQTVKILFIVIIIIHIIIYIFILLYVYIHILSFFYFICSDSQGSSYKTWTNKTGVSKILNQAQYLRARIYMQTDSKYCFTITVFSKKSFYNST